MASFFGCEFIFDGVQSRNYDLRIMNFSSGDTSGDAGSTSEIVQRQIYRRPTPFYYGRSTNKNLEFDLTIGSGDAISADQRGLIHRWLLGRMTYLPLRIVQSDMSVINYNVIFTSAQNEYIGNVQRGITLHAMCDSPWGYSDTKVITKTYSGSAIVNENFTIMNQSDSPDYLYPTTVTFTTSGIGNSFSISNLSLQSSLDVYSMTFDPLSAGETMSVNCDRQMFVSTTGLKRMPSFNKWFFRLIPGLNSINILGGITSLIISYKFPKKVGG
jgi:phage-related protein